MLLKVASATRRTGTLPHLRRVTAIAGAAAAVARSKIS
jgi:hypothetical protein